MKTTLLLIVICLYSCTSGKLIGDKIGRFPFNHKFYDSVRNSIQGVILPVMPIAVGSYSVQVALVDYAALEKQQHKYDILIYSLLFGIPAILFVIAWTFGRKGETIPMPDDGITDDSFIPPYEPFNHSKPFKL